MSFLRNVPVEEATSEVRTLYDQALQRHGFVPNMVKAFSHRPKVMAAWNAFLASIRDPMDPRRYELVTVAAAKALRSSYCMLAHGAVLAREFYPPAEVAAIAGDFRSAGLAERDVAIMEFAQKVVRDAAAISRAEVERLRTHGLTDTEIFDVAAAAAARCFYSKLIDALGEQPDARYAELPPEMRDKLTVGRPVSAD